MSHSSSDPENTSGSPASPSFSGASAPSPHDSSGTETPAAPAHEMSGQPIYADQTHTSPFPTAQQHIVPKPPVYATGQQGGYYPQEMNEPSWAWAPRWALGVSIFNVVISLIPFLNIVIMSVTSMVGLVLCILALVGISKDSRASKGMAITSIGLFLLSGVTLVLSYLLLAVASSA